MRLALREAEQARTHEDVPIGAVVVRDGELLAAAHNERELRQDPTAHAEILALREAARALGSWRVLDATLYVTLEPCAMCAGAIVLARVAARRLRRNRPEGWRLRQRARRTRRAATQPPPRGRSPGCSRPSAAELLSDVLRLAPSLSSAAGARGASSQVRRRRARSLTSLD